MKNDESAEETTRVGLSAVTSLLSLLVVGPSGSTTVPVPMRGVLTRGTLIKRIADFGLPRPRKRG